MSLLKITRQQNQKSGRRKGSEAMSAEVSPDSKCPICLDLFNNISYLDLCWHRFCFRCIHEWSKNKAECPLCKQPFNSIYHSIKSEQDFKKYDLQPLDNGSFGTFGGLAVNTIREQEMINFRRELYRRGVRVRTVRDGGRSRDTSAEFYRRNPACLHRLVPWIKRELTDGAIQEELRPFLQGRTEHFLHEFISFAKSPFNIEAYDQHAVYDCPAPSSNEDSSSNSSVIAISEDEEHSLELDPTINTTSTLSHSVWDDETPGPSYSTTAEQSTTEHFPPLNQTDVSQGDVNNDGCLSSDSDECVIVGFVKPTAERTPELVQLSSDSDESASEDTKEVPLLPQHIRFSSLSPPSSESRGPSGAGQSGNGETDHHDLHSKERCSFSTSRQHKRSSKSEKKDRQRRSDSDERYREKRWSKDRGHRRRTSRSREHRHSSRSPVISHSTLSKERGYSYSSSRDPYSKCDNNYKWRDSGHSYKSYSHYSQKRNDRVHYTEERSYYYTSRKYSDRHSYSRSRSRSRDLWRQDRKHSRSRTFSSSLSPSARRHFHHDKPGGKRKHKTRHLEEASQSTFSNLYPEGDSSTLSKHKRKSKEKHRKKSKEGRKTSRSLSVEFINEGTLYEQSKRHHKKKKKHKKKSKRHKSNERTVKCSPTIITIESDTDSYANERVTQANSSNKEIPIDHKAEDPATLDFLA
uniref:E3 ubiquitin-protein ligase Topors n=1 Tax=Mastacembelus armatus TaxID=205130 RepID=A0A7N8XEE0_9TELE